VVEQCVQCDQSNFQTKCHLSEIFGMLVYLETVCTGFKDRDHRVTLTVTGQKMFPSSKVVNATSS